MNTCSWNFPNMINVAQNKVGIVQDANSIQNRLALLLQTQPTEIFGDPEFGVGMKRFMWQTNSPNSLAELKQRIADQIRRYEPCIDPDSITFIDKQESENNVNPIIIDGSESNKVNLTIIMKTIFGETAEVSM